jgi:3'-phosphoadenosine 5'-phosphosulfate sulfotransferase (PAPS reductase)/FAD synthetase
MKVLSLGAGVQSSTLALMAEKGEIDKPDCAIFADTQAEPKAVYEWLDWLQQQLSYPVHVISYGDLYQEMMEVAQGTGKYKFLNVPVFTITGRKGKKGLLKRQCTTHYKIRPINQKIRELLGLKKRQRVPKGTNATKRPEDEVFLHADRVPIDKVDLRTWDEIGQPDLFFYNKDDFGQLNNCDGMCGV